VVDVDVIYANTGTLTGMPTDTIAFDPDDLTMRGTAALIRNGVRSVTLEVFARGVPRCEWYERVGTQHVLISSHATVLVEDQVGKNADPPVDFLEVEYDIMRYLDSFSCDDPRGKPANAIGVRLRSRSAANYFGNTPVVYLKPVIRRPG
jgi:hypothetical protein